MLTTFKDSADREWKIRFDGVLLRELREAHKIDLADVTGTTYTKLERDQSDLVTVLLFLLRQQARDAKVSPSSLSDSLVGECLEGAMQAIWGAAKVFFRPKLWSELQTNLETLSAWAKARPMMAAMNDPDMPQAMREVVMEMISQILRGQVNSALPSSTEPSSVSGPDASQSPPAINSPDTSASAHAA